MKGTVFVLALVLCLAGPANAILMVSLNGETTLPGGEIWLNRGDEVALEVKGDGSTSAPLEGFFFVEGPGSIDGHTMIYTDAGSVYYDLEELAQAAEATVEETLAAYRLSSGRNLSDLSKWTLTDSELEDRPLSGVLMTSIVFRCEGGGDVLLTLETDDEWTTYPDYTITIHQTAEDRTYHVDANSGDDSNAGLSPEEAFATIQKAIDSAYDGETVIVQPGTYEGFSFLGGNITVTSTDPSDSAVARRTEINGGVNFTGIEEPNCVLTGFKINEYVHGYGSGYTHATISHCIFEGNVVWEGTVISGCNGTISNCLVVGNIVRDGSLVVESTIDDCYGLIKNCTIANNFSDAGVGVEFEHSGSVTIENCIIYGNMADQISTHGATVNIRYSAIQDGRAGISASNEDFVNWGPGNIGADPCFVGAGYWDVEYPSEYFGGDYHLKSKIGWWDAGSSKWVYDSATSRCIDAGNPGGPLGDELWSPLNKRINMGAYGGTAEASKTPIIWSRLADLTNDGIVDGEDFACLTKDRYSTKKEKSGDLNRNGTVRLDDLAILVGEWLRTTLWH